MLYHYEQMNSEDIIPDADLYRKFILEIDVIILIRFCQYTL